MALAWFSCPKGDWVSGDAVNDPANRPVILVSGTRGVNQRLGNIQNCRQRGARAAIAPAPSSAIGRLEREAIMKIRQPAVTGRRAAQKAARLSFTPTTGGAARAQQQAVAEFSLGGLLKGALGGIATGGIGGALAGAAIGGFGGGSDGPRPRPTAFGPGGAFAGPALPGGAGQCASGCFKVGGKCLCPGDAFPGGAPLISPAPTTGGTLPAPRDNYGAAVLGAFNMPALEPAVEMRPHRSCPPGMVLGKDDLCYPKQILGKRNRFRKWRGEIAPPITRAQMKAINQADKAKNKVKELAPKVGLRATNK